MYYNGALSFNYEECMIGNKIKNNNKKIHLTLGDPAIKGLTRVINTD